MFWFKKFLYSIVFIGFSAAHAGAYEDYVRSLDMDDVRTLEGLLQRGLDPNAVTPRGEPGLLFALRENSVRVAALLIAHPDIEVEARNASDESPLMMAALRGHLGLCKALIARDADVNKPGWAPLHYAATGGHAEVITLLLEHSAYIDAESPNGTTPLMMAAMYGNAESVKVLLDAGADPAVRNALRLSALDFARRADRTDSQTLISAALRERGPKPSW